MSPMQDLNSLLVISGNQYWRPIQTCSFEDLKLQAPLPTNPPRTDIWWFANEARAMGERVAPMLSPSCLWLKKEFPMDHHRKQNVRKFCSPCKRQNLLKFLQSDEGSSSNIFICIVSSEDLVTFGLINQLIQEVKRLNDTVQTLHEKLECMFIIKI